MNYPTVNKQLSSANSNSLVVGGIPTTFNAQTNSFSYLYLAPKKELPMGTGLTSLRDTLYLISRVGNKTPVLTVNARTKTYIYRNVSAGSGYDNSTSTILTRNFGEIVCCLTDTSLPKPWVEPHYARIVDTARTIASCNGAKGRFDKASYFTIQ